MPGNSGDVLRFGRETYFSQKRQVLRERKENSVGFGSDDWFDLGEDLFDQTRFARFDVQAK